MVNSAITVENLSKLYRIGSGKSGSLKEVFTNQFKKLKKNRFKNNSEDFWALKDLSFEVEKGEAVGIIGKNGAGKSTLLKILSKITAPTTGRIILDGKVSSLLEVGTGFHPELSGAENIYLNGSILGMKRAEIKRKFDEIVAFSGIEKFIYTPVKRYSSGMYVRLAFAVAAHLESEILIIDEVLAVGDIEFQKKCLGKMKDTIHQGRTVLFVSHNMQAINTLTQRCIYLENGKVLLQGETSKVMREYIQKNTDSGQRCIYKAPLDKKNGNFIEQIIIKTSEVDGVHYWGEPVEFNFIFNLDAPEVTGFSFQIVNSENISICHFSPEGVSLKNVSALGNHRFSIKCIIPKLRLFMGKYTLVTWLADNKSKTIIENLENVCEFEISMIKKVRENYDWKETDCTYIEDYYFQ